MRLCIRSHYILLPVQREPDPRLFLHWQEASSHNWGPPQLDTLYTPMAGRGICCERPKQLQSSSPRALTCFQSWKTVAAVISQLLWLHTPWGLGDCSCTQQISRPCWVPALGGALLWPSNCSSRTLGPSSCGALPGLSVPSVQDSQLTGLSWQGRAPSHRGDSITPVN